MSFLRYVFVCVYIVVSNIYCVVFFVFVLFVIALSLLSIVHLDWHFGFLYRLPNNNHYIGTVKGTLLLFHPTLSAREYRLISPNH
jgi:hypothetical protein